MSDPDSFFAVVFMVAGGIVLLVLGIPVAILVGGWLGFLFASGL